MDLRHRSLIPMVLALMALAFAGAITAFAVMVDWSQLDDIPARTDTRRGAAPPAPAPDGRDLLLGVQLHPLWNGVTPREAVRELDVARRAGARVVRIDVGWASLETAGKGRISGDYARRLDAFLAGAASRGLAVIATLHETPCWASSAPASRRQGCRGPWWTRGVAQYPPRRASDYADAAAYVARRWGRRLSALEIWNEPNVRRFLAAPDPVVSYARLVRAAYRPVKRTAPGLTVLAGSMLRSDGDFLTGLYERGRILGSYDAISYHPYSDAPGDPEAKHGAQRSVIAGTGWLHGIMQRAGDDRAVLWATEAGASTCSPQLNAECVSEEEQAKRIAGYIEALRRFPFVRALVIYNLRDKGTDPANGEDGFGLVRRDLSPKPAFEAFRVAAAQR